MFCISHQATHLLFKYYISKLGGGVMTFADLADTGGVQDLRKPADVILERSLILIFISNLKSFNAYQG